MLNRDIYIPGRIQTRSDSGLWLPGSGETATPDIHVLHPHAIPVVTALINCPVYNPFIASCHLNLCTGEIDPKTYDHVRGVTFGAYELSKLLLPACVVPVVTAAAALHDVGKVHALFYEKVILNPNLRLSDEERILYLPLHALTGAEIIAAISDSKDKISMITAVAHHYFTNGYPSIEEILELPGLTISEQNLIIEHFVCKKMFEFSKSEVIDFISIVDEDQPMRIALVSAMVTTAADLFEAFSSDRKDHVRDRTWEQAVEQTLTEIRTKLPAWVLPIFKQWLNNQYNKPEGNRAQFEIDAREFHPNILGPISYSYKLCY